MIKAYIPKDSENGLYPCFVSCNAAITKTLISEHFGCSWSTLRRKGFSLMHLFPKKKKSIDKDE